MIVWPASLTVVPMGDWPGVRTLARRSSPFDASLDSTLETLRRELRALVAKDVELQIAVRPGDFRIDGRPRANAKVDSPAVILTFTAPGIGALSYPCDTFTTWEANLRAIALALEALRKVDRYGVTKRGEQYRGFMAIEATATPAGFATAAEAQRFIQQLILDAGWTTTPGDWPFQVRQAKRLTHPDSGGDAAAFQRVSLAEAKLRDEGLLR